MLGSAHAEKSEKHTTAGAGRWVEPAATKPPPLSRSAAPSQAGAGAARSISISPRFDDDGVVLVVLQASYTSS
jgi:hypothetical protein